MQMLTPLTVREMLAESVANDIYFRTDEGHEVFVETGCFTATGAQVKVMDGHGVRRWINDLNPESTVYVKIYR